METKKEARILNTVSADKRAKGITLPRVNPSIVSLGKSAAKLPTSLVPVFEKIDGRGKEGIKLDALRSVASLGAPRHITWKIRTLVKMGFVKAVAEPQELTIKRAVAAKKSKPNNKLAKVA